MRVKVGDTWYDAQDIPIKIELSEGEREQIKNLTETGTRGVYGYAIVPLEKLQWSEGQAREWMNDQRLALSPLNT